MDVIIENGSSFSIFNRDFTLDFWWPEAKTVADWNKTREKIENSVRDCWREPVLKCSSDYYMNGIQWCDFMSRLTLAGFDITACYLNIHKQNQFQHDKMWSCHAWLMNFDAKWWQKEPKNGKSNSICDSALGFIWFTVHYEGNETLNHKSNLKMHQMPNYPFILFIELVRSTDIYKCFSSQFFR